MGRFINLSMVVPVGSEAEVQCAWHEYDEAKSALNYLVTAALDDPDQLKISIYEVLPPQVELARMSRPRASSG